MLTVSLHVAQPSDSTTPDPPSEKTPEPNARAFVQYTRAELLRLSKSPLVKIPDGMPPFKEWFGEWGDSGAAARKEATSDSPGQLARDRRQVYLIASMSFRRDAEDGDGARELLSSGRPTFKNALSFSQASGSAMGSMGSFRHPSSRLDADSRREEREREREREGRRDTENLRNLHISPVLYLALLLRTDETPRLANWVVIHVKAQRSPPASPVEVGETIQMIGGERVTTTVDVVEVAHETDPDEVRNTCIRGYLLLIFATKGDREPANGQKRERDSWAAAEERRGASGVSGRRRGAAEERSEGRSKEDRALPKNERDKSAKEEQEPAWMGDYIPETGGQGILGSGGAEDSIQAWKRELKEKERGAQGGGDMDVLEDEDLGGLGDEVTHMKLVEDKAKQDRSNPPPEDDGLDEIQRFKKMMQESDRKRREEAERNARELAGKYDTPLDAEQTTDAQTAATLPVPPGLTKSTAASSSAPTPPPAPEPSVPTDGRVGGVSLISPSWPVSSAITPSATTAALSPPGWTQSNSSLPDASPTNPRLSPVQPRRFPQDGSASQVGGQDGSQVGTRSTSRFANFFGDKQREPTGPSPRFNDNPAPNASHPPFLQGSNEPQLLDTLLARLAESQVYGPPMPAHPTANDFAKMRPQAQAAPQGQDRTFGQRTQGMTPPQGQYGNPLPQNAMNMHAAPPLIQHQRQQLSLHQQQQQLLSSLNANSVLPSNSSNVQGMNHGGLPMSGLNPGILNPSLNLDIEGRFVSDNLVPGLRPRNGSIGFDEDFQVNPAAGLGRVAMQQHRPQQSFDALHGRPQQQQQQQPIYNVGNRTPSGGYRNGPSPIGGHNPNPMQRAPDLPQYLGGMSGPLGAGGANGPQQYSNRLGGMGNLGGMLGAGGPVNQPRFDERQRMQQGQNAAMHHQPGQSLSGMGGLPLDFSLLQQQQQQPSQRQMPRSAGGYGIQQNQASMGPRGASGLHGLGAQQYPGHMHNDFVVQPNQSTNANDIMAMFLASQGNNMGA
ncbi:hypothetical protein FRC10_000555 [Ceratobasidium sp. 414]|nr:hypothetical protein FRC10_000555 [Ceratobasidium sp. 414]